MNLKFHFIFFPQMAAKKNAVNGDYKSDSEKGE